MHYNDVGLAMCSNLTNYIIMLYDQGPSHSLSEAHC